MDLISVNYMLINHSQCQSQQDTQNAISITGVRCFKDSIYHDVGF